MKHTIYAVIITALFYTPTIADSTECSSILSKMKPSCNKFLGTINKGGKKLKEISEKTKTNEVRNPGGTINLKKLNKENKTINQTIKNMKKKK